MEQGSIKPINKETVHKICSGQVVLNLAIAVKELVENALDAEATNVEVKIVNYGLDSIEVIDNGCGVKEENFAALTLKHFTSKIEEFTDLDSVATFGFRGEALSSLCALSDLSVTTKHETAQYATSIKYDHSGHIESKTPTARAVGTTVALTNLFCNLPVRRKEFLKNHKKEFAKMCNILYAYCMVSKNVKFMCRHQINKQTNIIFSTQGKGNINDCIISIFGIKQVQSLVEVKLVPPDEAIAADFGIKTVPDTEYFSFEFLISSVTHGSGRSSADRQYFFVNSRPCEATKIAKVVNECYKSYNSHQYPFVYLNINVKNGAVDVNVTPDKRKIFLEQEKYLLATLKMSLIEIFKEFPCTYKMENVNASQSLLKKRSLDYTNSEVCKTKKYRKLHEESSIEEIGSFVPKQKTQMNLSSFLDFSFKKKSFKSEEECYENDKSVDEQIDELLDNAINNSMLENEASNINNVISEEKSDVEIGDSNGESTNNHNSSAKSSETEEIHSEAIICKNNDPTIKVRNSICTISEEIKQEDILNKAIKVKNEKEKQKNQKPGNTTEESISNKKIRGSVVMDVSIDSIRDQLKKQTIDDGSLSKIKFKTEISPSTGKESESELKKHITKDMFSKMEILGQFNHAFIIVRLDDDLFIIDQHACDEKYNFETLQRTTVLENQTLVVPKTLNLTTADETILLENEEVFNKNGFFFQYDPNGKPTERIKLTSLPLSKGYIFGKDDIDEMIFMLKEGADANCRPSRVRGMFASRACRKSVMVGKPLSKPDMRKLVDHMGEINQPWNCPHGRPTMRHLANLRLL